MPALRVGCLAAIACVALAACDTPPPQPASAGDDAAREFARGVVADFGPALKTALSGALAEGGPLNAVNVCHTQAPALAAATGAQHDVTIRRITARPRNPANAADAWETEQLGRFEDALAAGTDPATLDALHSVTIDGVTRHRYLKPIMVAPLCLTCHGEALAPDLEARLDALYPQDAARGYRTGDLRGAFSVTWTEP